MRSLLVCTMAWAAGVLAIPSCNPIGDICPRQQSPFVPSPGAFPETGDDAIAGGIFCISLNDLSVYLTETGNNPGATGPESPSGAGEISHGSGPYPAQMIEDPYFPGHTIYAPIEKPDTQMPFIAWANGGCATDGSQYRNFLTEIASYGYVISADGPASGGGGGLGGSQSMVSDMRASLDWATGRGADKYGDIDIEKIATMGHSCGGLEAMSTAYHDARVKRIVLLNIAIFQDERRYLLDQIDVPVAWFVGGPSDMGYPNAQKDYELLPEGLSAYKASLETGHGGTFFATNGGKQGKAVVNYLEWQFRGDNEAKALLLDGDAVGSLVSDNWDIEFKNWD